MIEGGALSSMVKIAEVRSIAFSTLKKIKTQISNALPYYIFENETTSAHLRSMMNKIESVLNAHVVDK